LLADYCSINVRGETEGFEFFFRVSQKEHVGAWNFEKFIDAEMKGDGRDWGLTSILVLAFLGGGVRN
jgi:hypothetical protein